APAGVLQQREQGVRELWRHLDPAVAPRLHGALPVQRLRPLLQDERGQPTPHEAPQTAGTFP
ncbi:hypothetical protein IscW_ISCW004190, partial [Ixodes scapularis]